ncbi:hypothetical protein [Rhodococcus sp. ARC_M6]|uniref:hypothetical protein n=1 Tax=Rhodococcus sp. ARC_M6 TaxID=2928852 RepID=UPI001FB3B959|nr:hypothetical protein [Rhodococcus sp. ARC_M6]MCJ0907475.1 hypothetical protein [Rhodococcus sp. ARC_M6]
MSAKALVAVLAAVGFIAGWVVLATPTSVVGIQATGSMMSCGSPLFPKSAPKTFDETLTSLGILSEGTEAKCEATFASRRTIGWSLVVVGGVAGVGAAVALRSERKQSASSAPDGAVAATEPQ